MDAAILARIQFAFTVGFHYIFPPLTIGLSWLIVWMMARFMRTHDEMWWRAARFWTDIFTVTFVVGVATGITMEFQFGMNWSQFSRFAGDVIGTPLAAEGIFTFFLESAFVAVLVYGWRRFSPRVLMFSAVMVAVGATASAFWIIAANSWMQTPAGYALADGRLVLTDLWAAVFSASLFPRLLHTVDGALMTGAFFMMGISAWFLLKGRSVEQMRRILKLALVAAALTSAAQLVLGHYHAIQVTNTQPMKLAAVEGIFNTQKRAPILIFGIPDAGNATVHAAVRIPGLLSFLTSGSSETEVKGLLSFPRDEWPPILLTFFTFHAMVGLGMYFIFICAVGLFMWWRGMLFGNKWFLRMALLSIPLPFIANELGWIAAEVGRQPWIIYGIMKTSDAISVTVPAWQIMVSLAAFAIVYSALFALWIFLMRRIIVRGPAEGEEAAG